jgi:hypothetical protein
MGGEYRQGEWWSHIIQPYSVMKQTLKGQGLEQNHLVHAMFFRNGPLETRHLVGEVPCLTLSTEEHRGAKTSFHHLKDGTIVGQGKRSFAGCGMDGYLIGRGIRMKGPFSKSDVLKAIDASADYWRMIGMEHCAEALGEFKARHLRS